MVGSIPDGRVLILGQALRTPRSPDVGTGREAHQVLGEVLTALDVEESVLSRIAERQQENAGAQEPAEHRVDRRRMMAG